MSAGLVAAAVGAIAMSGFSIASAICAGLSPEPASHGQAAGIRLFAGRVAAAATLFAAAWIAGRVRVPLQDLFLWAASLGFAILMPVTVAAVWWSRANRYGAIAAMLTGVLAFVFLLEMRSYGIDFRPASGDEFRIVFPGLSGSPRRHPHVDCRRDDRYPGVGGDFARDAALSRAGTHGRHPPAGHAAGISRTRLPETGHTGLPAARRICDTPTSVKGQDAKGTGGGRQRIQDFDAGNNGAIFLPRIPLPVRRTICATASFICPARARCVAH